MPRRSCRPATSPSPSIQPQDQPLNAVQAAAILGVTPGFLAQLRIKGRGPAYHKVGRFVRYFLTDIIAWVKSNRVETVA